MESLSFVSGGKGLISTEANSFSDDFARRKMKMPWWAGDSKAPCTFGNNILVSGEDTIISNQHLGELGLEGKQLPEISIGNVFSSKVVDGEKIFSPFALSPPFSLEDDSTSRISCSIVETYRRELPLIDLKLGGFGEPRDGKSSRIYNGPPIASSSNSSVPQKRMRMGMNSPTSYCQVYGCNKDLSSSKEYHKRHKVCEAHSKTSKVVVNGIEQRFCQQCSRFHLLSEFDYGKRSCRKHLAGHNERRRKHQVGFHSRRTGRHTQSYNGTSAGFDSTLTVPSFICPDLLPSSILRQENHRVNDWCSMGGSCSVLRDTLGNDNFPDFDAASNIKGFSGMAETGFALSLLSSQSQNSSSHLSGIPVARSLAPGSDTRYGMAQVSERLMRINCQASTSGMPNSFSLPGISSAEGSHPSPILISGNSEPINFDIADGLHPGSNLSVSKDQLCSEDGATIDLLQLSSQLQHVECERQSIQVKLEHGVFRCPSIT